jgi:hypothetical protein
MFIILLEFCLRLADLSDIGVQMACVVNDQVNQPVDLGVGFLTKLFSGFSRNTKLAKMLPCFAKLLRVSQDQMFIIFVFHESYNFRKTREIRLIRHNGTCHGF